MVCFHNKLDPRKKIKKSITPLIVRKTRIMADTPEEHQPGADVGGGGSQEDLLDICQREPGLLLIPAESFGNPLELLFSQAQVSKAFCEATLAALKGLKSVALWLW